VKKLGIVLLYLVSLLFGPWGPVLVWGTFRGARIRRENPQWLRRVRS